MKEPEISIVIPAYNEQRNVSILYKEIVKVMNHLKKSYEIIFIDDNSTDRTLENLLSIKKKDSNVKIIKFGRNFGQTAAWDAGFKNSSGKLVITMDADLQNNPKDIPKLLKKLEQGYDVISGWRYNRKDKFFKRLFSKFSRLLRRKIIKDKIHDSGCSLKVYKRKCIKDLDLHGEMHRYITELLSLRGYKIGEVKVSHRSRKYEKTKYNIIRLPKGFLDLLVVAFWQKYSARPIHLFGGFGLLTTLLGFLTGLYLLYVKFVNNVGISDRPLLLLAILLVIVGIQFIIFGLVADILAKLYYSKDKTYYTIEKIY